MKIVIDIPEEFEEHFNKDRFSDSLARAASDIESFGFQLAGRYEQETITMIRKAFEQATPLESQPTDAKQDCEHCIHTYGTLGCCDMVNNEWVYDCDFGKEHYKKEHEAQPTDAISREEAIFIVDEYAIGGETWAQRKDCVELLKQLPSVQPQRMQGEWIPIRNYQGLIVAYKCSKCGKTPRRRVKSNYCPNCGAEMSGGEGK